MHQTHDHGLRADPLCDGAQDQTKAAFKSAEQRKRRPSSSRVRRRTINDKLRSKAGSSCGPVGQALVGFVRIA
jgi:hypothetical protein